MVALGWIVFIVCVFALSGLNLYLNHKRQIKRLELGLEEE